MIYYPDSCDSCDSFQFHNNGTKSDWHRSNWFWSNTWILSFQVFLIIFRVFVPFIVAKSMLCHWTKRNIHLKQNPHHSLENLPSRCFLYIIDKSLSKEVCSNLSESIQWYSFNIKKKKKNRKEKKKEEKRASSKQYHLSKQKSFQRTSRFVKQSSF